MNPEHALVIATLSLLCLPIMFLIGRATGQLRSGSWQQRCQHTQTKLRDTTHEAGQLLIERDAYRKAYLEQRTENGLCMAALKELQEELDTLDPPQVVKAP